jgi:hypothetical protein
VRAVYYVFAFLCGVVISLWPYAARAVARLESSANIAIIVLGVLLAYMSVLDTAAGPGPVVNPFTPEAVGNLAISAAWAYLAYARSAVAP